MTNLRTIFENMDAVYRIEQVAMGRKMGCELSSRLV